MAKKKNKFGEPSCLGVFVSAFFATKAQRHEVITKELQ